MIELLDIRKVAERTSMSPDWIKQAVKAGIFPKGALRHGKTLWRGETIVAWIDGEVLLQTEKYSLADALFSPVQQRILGLLFGQPEHRFQRAAVMRLAGSGPWAAHRVLTRLVGAGFVTATRSGNQKHYQANRESPVFAELHGLIVKVILPLRFPLANQCESEAIPPPLAQESTCQLHKQTS